MANWTFRTTVLPLVVLSGALAGATAAALAAASAQAAEEPPAPQGPPPSPVRYTEAREQSVLRTIRLPGTVESRTISLVASEVSGLVVELPVREGSSVRKDQPLARLREDSLELRLISAGAQLKEARARLDQAERNLNRARDLFVSKVMSQAQLDDADSEFTAWQGRVEILETDIRKIRLDLERSTIKAPFGGTVVSKRTEVGQWIAAGDPVMEIVALDDLEVRVDVPERYYRNLKATGVVTVTFDSLPGLQVNGRVSAIVPKADPQARTFPVKVRIPNRDGRIGVGMLSQVVLPAGESYRATVVPRDAVVRQGDEQVVFLINGDQKVERATVSTGDGVGSWIVVEGPVKPGTKVVTRGNERLQPGQSVRGEPLEYAQP
jgi:RND family efflux transporter MFP subunit